MIKPDHTEAEAFVNRVESLLEPVSASDPVGPDLDYDPGRDTIRSVFEIGFSDELGSGSDVNWFEIIGLVEAQLLKSKDIWLATYLMRAGAQSGQLNVVRTGAEVLAGMLERYWDDVHPKLEELGLVGRVTPCATLSGISEFIGPLRRTILVSHPRLGSYSGADFARFENNGEAEADIGMFRAAMHELSKAELLAAVEALTAVKSALERADAVFMDKADGDGPNFRAIYDSIDQLCRSVSVHAGPALIATLKDSNFSMGGPESVTNSAPASGAAYFSGSIETRDDVIRAIDSISNYYRRNEPSSPVPTLLSRAREWVALDFLAILKDIAPNSVEDAKRVLIFTREESNHSD